MRGSGKKAAISSAPGEKTGEIGKKSSNDGAFHGKTGAKRVKIGIQPHKKTEHKIMTERQREITLRFLAQPTDVNFGGKVHGGTVMKWIDQGGYACAVGWSGRYCVTAYVGGIRFYKPVLVGSLVEVTSRVIYTGRTSMHISVDVRAGDLKDGEFTKTTHCVMVFVAVNDHGNPTPVDKWEPVSESDKALEQYALKLMDLRKGIDAEMSKYFLPVETE